MTSSSTPAADAPASGLRDFLFRWRGWGVIVLGAAALAVHGVLRWPPLPLAAYAWAAGPIVLVGIAFRVWARCYFTRGSDTRRIQAHRLVVFGPYRRVRNPLYVGNMLVAAGLVLAWTEPFTAAAFLALLFVLYNGVIRSEEAVLLSTYGESYAAFRRRVPCWVPRLVPLPADPDAPAAELGHSLRKEWKRIAGALAGWAAALAVAWLAA